jgi:hypothetical protein
MIFLHMIHKQNSVKYMPNFKLTAKIGKIKARDDDFTKEAQKILSMVSNKLAVIILADLRPISPQLMLPSKLFRMK